MSNPIKESTLERWIQNQMKVWESEKKIIEKEEKPRPFITISRQYGCFANDIAEEIAKALNATTTNNKWSVYDKNLINKIEQQYNISEKIVETIDTRKREEMSELWRTMLADLPPQAAVFQKLASTIRTIAIHGNAILIGRGSVVITKGLRYGLHLRFVAPLQYRIQKVMENQKIKDRLAAEKLIEEKDKQRHEFMTQYIKFNAYDPASYDITINVAQFTKEQVAQISIAGLKVRKLI
ncbi:MAG TPA: cytidylate kinase-like family protein [Spirochaetota bacterium]|jgi:cytidylate kinase|nr:cytidylate kinase-like family protein [Spirochaetota bacterium]HOT19862.1 cytidylate kinase-like family protein [Spirochaetota bacterium]HQI39369.1 cytidylate kinase-like family protein [Spirochaetota bacterium]HQK07288.1 cytidylate kinase-like family protein [Spirochaetota bacterium]